jgi:hypothetical protein
VAAESSLSTTPTGGRPIGKVIATGTAARYWEFPGWVAVTVTMPVDPLGVSWAPSSVAGPESSVRATGSPLVDDAEIAKAGERVEIPAGETAEMVCGNRDVKLASRERFALITMDTVGAEETRSPVQPANALPGPGVATAVAWAPGG